MFYKKNDSDIFINWIPDKKTIAELKPIQLEKFINKVGQKFL